MSFNQKLATTSKANPCPICGDTTGKCRHATEDEAWFCAGHSSVRKFDVVGEFKCVSHSKDEFWAIFKIDNSREWSEEQRADYKAKQARRQQQNKQRAEKLQVAEQQRALPVEERHKLYSEILNQLKIEPATTDDLKRRGFTDKEIENCGFKSVNKYQKLASKCDKRLPGIGNDGKSLVVREDGYLCPLKDFDGHITGLQYRIHKPQDGNRYRWLSTPQNATLKVQPEHENPLAVFHPPGDKPFGIAICEGTGAKPYFVSQRLNLVTIGAAGGQHLSSPKLLEKYIKQAFDKYGHLPIIVIPDAGFALNQQVRKKLLGTFEWLQNNFQDSEIKALDWNQIHKSRGDIDELQTEDLLQVRWLRFDYFLKKYNEVFTSKQYHNWATNRVKLTADIKQYEKWLNIPSGIQNDCDILLIRKSLGGGKTQALIEFLKQFNAVSLLVGYRNSLLNNTIARANNMGLNALHIKDTVEVVQGNYVNFAQDETIKLWGGCADSFLKFNAVVDRNPNYNLTHDEICSVLGHLKGGGTLKGRQQQAIEWVTNTINNSQFSIMMDANLSDKDVDFIKQLFPHKRIKVLDSEYPPDPRTFYFLETASSEKEFTSVSKFLPSQLIGKAKTANKVLWISDSQRSCEVADEILTKAGHKHYRLDGKTSHDELSKQLQDAPKQFITTHQLDSLSLSPSGESGLSIDLFNYFDAVCFDIRGTVGVNTLTQLSARLRDTNVPIYVACPEFVNMTSNPCPYAIKKIEKVIKERLDILLAKAMQTDGELVDSDYVRDMFDEIGNKAATDPWFIESLKDAKNLKYEHSNLKLCLKTALTQAGHRVIDLVDSASEKHYEEVKETKEEVMKREAEKIYNSEDIDFEKAQELSKQDVNYDVKCKIRKARLRHKLPGIEDTQSWNTDFIKTVLLDEQQFTDKRWRLKQLQDDELGKAVFKSEKKFNFENGFQFKDVWKFTSTKMEALKLLGVGEIITAGIFSSQDAWVRKIIDKYYEQPEWFDLIGIPRAKRTLNSDGSPNSLRYVKNMVDKFLDFFGLEAKLCKKSKANRLYSVNTPSEVKDYLSDIDNCLNRKAEETIKASQEISLKAIADKAAEAKSKDEEWEQQHQAELKKRMLSQQLNHSQSEMVAFSHSYIYKPKEQMPPTEISTIQPTQYLDAEWYKPDSIADVASMLEYCDTPQMLAELRGTKIPVSVLKVAARQLPEVKRNQIRQWVLQSTGNNLN
ncbi:MAG: hypothetical protein AAF915_16770 [Cyanobacteria bacterium P01_D01_bin.50]